MRYLGIDFGTKRTGLAISEDGKFAWELKTIEGDILEQIIDFVEKEKVDMLVIGLPLGNDHKPTRISNTILEFTEELKSELSVPIFLIDEEMTSMTARNILSEQNIFKDKQNKRVDQLSAKIILQMYLDSL